MALFLHVLQIDQKVHLDQVVPHHLDHLVNLMVLGFLAPQLIQQVQVALHRLWDLGYPILLWIRMAQEVLFLQDVLILLLVLRGQVVLSALKDLMGLGLPQVLVLLFCLGLLCLLLHQDHQRDQLGQLAQMVQMVLKALGFQVILGDPLIQMDRLDLMGQRDLVSQAVLRVLVILWHPVVLVGPLDLNQVYQGILLVLLVQQVPWVLRARRVLVHLYHL